MSKSLWNFYTLRDLIENGATYREIRYVLVTGHYRNKLNFSTDGLISAKSSLKRIDNFVDNLHAKIDENNNNDNNYKIYLENFEKDLADDMNISGAISRLFQLIKDVNKLSSISRKNYDDICMILENMDKIFGFVLVDNKKDMEISEKEILKLIEERNIARKNRNFERADEIRDYLLSKKIVIKDGKNGTTWQLA